MIDARLQQLIDENERFAEQVKLPPYIVENENLLFPSASSEEIALREYVYTILERLLATQPNLARNARDLDVFISADEGIRAAVDTDREPPTFIVSKGLIESFESEDEIAGVLAHEITHYQLFQKKGEHAVSKAVEGLCDLNSALMLDAAGYQRDGLLQFMARQLKEHPEPKSFLRIIHDEHPTMENRVRRLTELKFALDRDRGEQRGPDGLPVPATPIPEPVKEAARAIAQKDLMERYFELCGYEGLSNLDKVNFLRHFIEHTTVDLSAAQTGGISEKLMELDFDPALTEEAEAINQLGATIFQCHYRSETLLDQWRSRPDRKNSEQPRPPMFPYKSWYDVVYDVAEKKRYTLAGEEYPDRERVNSHPEELYFGKVRELLLTQKRFIEATDPATAAREAKLLQEQAAPFVSGSWRDEYIDFYIGSKFSERSHFPWVEFPLPKPKKESDGKLPPVSWDKHMEWAKDDHDIAVALAMTGVATDPRLREILKDKKDLPPAVKPSRDYRYRSEDFIWTHLHVQEKRPEPVTLEEQQAALLALQQRMIGEADWSLLTKDFWSFIETYEAALRPPLRDYRDQDFRVQAPFVEAFLAHTRAGVEDGSIALGDVQHFFSLESEHSYHEEDEAGKCRITLGGLMRRQKRAAHYRQDGHLCGYDPYVQFAYAAPVAWFDQTYRMSLERRWTSLYEGSRDKEKSQLPPLRQLLRVKPEDYLGLTPPVPLAALLDRFEELAHTGHGDDRKFDGETLCLAFTILVEEALPHEPCPMPPEMLVRVNNFRSLAAAAMTGGYAVTHDVTLQITRQTQAMIAGVAAETDILALAENYRRFDANYRITYFNGSRLVAPGYRINIFDQDARLREAYETRLLALLDQEKKPATRRAVLNLLLETREALGEPPRKESHFTIERGRIDYRARLSSPEFRDNIVNRAVAELAGRLGRDDGTPKYRARLDKEMQGLLKKLPPTTAFAIIARIGTAIEAQMDAAYFLRDLLADQGLSKLMSDPWKMVLGEGVMQYLKSDENEPLRISLIEFLQKPLSPESRAQMMDRIRKQDGYWIFNGNSKENENSDDKSGWDFENMRQQAGFDFMFTRLSQMHREYWSLPMELRAIGMHDLLFPADLQARRKYGTYQDYAYHRLFPDSLIPDAPVAELLARCDRNKYDYLSSSDRHYSPLHFSGRKFLRKIAPLHDKGKIVWGGVKRGMNTVTHSAYVAYANARTAITQIEALRRFGEIDLETNQISREAVEAYIAQLEPPEAEMIVSALMAGKIPSGKKSSMGKTINQTLSAARAAGDKVRQAASGHPDTPEDIRAELKTGRSSTGAGREDSKTMVSPPYRWQIFEWLEREKLIGENRVAGDLPEISHVGPLLGAGSYGVTVRVDRGPKRSTSITLLRPHVHGQANREFSLMEKTCEALVAKRPRLRPIRDMVRQAKTSLDTETDMDKAARQIELGGTLYDGLAITVDGERFTFSVAKLLGHGSGYKETEIVPGRHFNDIAGDASTDPAHLERLATALATAENLMSASGAAKDEDRHGGQQRIQGNHIGLFDLAGLSLEPTTVRQLELLGTVMGEVVKAGGKNSGSAFAKAVDKHARTPADGCGDERLYLASAQRAQIAQHDFNQYVPADRQRTMMATLYQGPYMAPALRAGLKRGLGVAQSIFAHEMKKAAQNSGITIEPSKEIEALSRSAAISVA